MKSLFIVTASYPYDSAREATFLDLELIELVRVATKTGFDITIFPQSCSGRIQASEDVLHFCNVDMSVSRRLASKYLSFCDLAFVFLSSRLWKGMIEVFNSKLTIRQLLSWEKRRRAVYSALSGNATGHVIAYSYWFDSAASAISCLRSENKILKSFCRAHGWDLYEERIVHPLRYDDLLCIDTVFCVSKFGMNYLKDMFSDFAYKITYSYLGTEFGKYIPVDFECIEFVSCSYIVPVKRVSLIAQSVMFVAEKHKNIYFKWTHFGGMVDMDLLNHTSSCSSNITIHFAGDVDNKDIIRYYMKGVHLFINLSVSEGLPVSIIEALSCSIPVLATRVGGNPEAINENFGALVDVSADIVIISDAIERLIFSKDYVDYRVNAFNYWVDNFQASQNYKNFCSTLIG